MVSGALGTQNASARAEGRRGVFELPSKHDPETGAVDLSLPLRDANCVEKSPGRLIEGGLDRECLWRNGGARGSTKEPYFLDFPPFPVGTRCPNVVAL